MLAALAPLNRDNARTPVQWDASRHAGFTTGTPWIAVNPNANHINAAAQVDDPDSVYSFYRQVIALRHTEPVVSHGDFTMLLPDDPHVYAFTRALTGFDVSSGSPTDSPTEGAGIPELLVLGNFSGEERDADTRGRGLGRRGAGPGQLSVPTPRLHRWLCLGFGAGCGAERPFRGRGASCGPGNCRCCAGAAAPDRRS